MKPKTRFLGVKVPQALIDEIERVADESGRSVSDILRAGAVLALEVNPGRLNRAVLAGRKFGEDVKSISA